MRQGMHGYLLPGSKLSRIASPWPGMGKVGVHILSARQVKLCLPVFLQQVGAELLEIPLPTRRTNKRQVVETLLPQQGQDLLIDPV